MNPVEETTLSTSNRGIAAEIDGLDHSQFRTYTEANVPQLVVGIARGLLPLN